MSEKTESQDKEKVYITMANTSRIVFNSNISGLDLKGEVYKIPIYFLSLYEANSLLAIQELLKDPEKYFNEIYIPYHPEDTFSLVYEGISPSYHSSSECIRLSSQYENYTIPAEIKEQGHEKAVEFRSWFSTVKHLINQPDIFVERLRIRWGIITNPNAIKIVNSGSNEVENLTIEELQIKIDSLIKEAGRFYYLSEINKEILKRFSKLTYLAHKVELIINNTTNYSDSEVKELLLEYDLKFKKPLKSMLIEYYRLKHNPTIQMQGYILENLGFRPCTQCYNQYISIDDLF